jgi:hypothetical protein
MFDLTTLYQFQSYATSNEMCWREHMLKWKVWSRCFFDRCARKWSWRDVLCGSAFYWRKNHENISQNAVPRPGIELGISRMQARRVTAVPTSIPFKMLQELLRGAIDNIRSWRFMRSISLINQHGVLRVALCRYANPGMHNLFNNFVHSLSQFSVHRSRLPVRLLGWYSRDLCYLYAKTVHCVNWWRWMKSSLWTVYVLVKSALDQSSSAEQRTLSWSIWLSCSSCTSVRNRSSIGETKKKMMPRRKVLDLLQVISSAS